MKPNLIDPLNNPALNRTVHTEPADPKDNALLLQWWESIRKHAVFNNLTDEELQKVLQCFLTVSGRPGQIVIQEGMDESSNLLLVLEGELDVIKNDITDDQFSQKPSRFALAKLTKGDIAGEFSFITGSARSATIKSVTASRLLSMTREDFKMLEHLHRDIYTKMLKNLLHNIAEKARQTSANEAKILRIELEKSLLNSRSNLFFSYVIGLLCVYNLAIHIIISLSADAETTSITSAIIIMLFAAGLVMMVRHSNLPLSIIGLTTKNWRKALRESLPWTALIIAVSFLVKWILIQTIPRYADLPLLDFNMGGQTYLAFNFVLYGLHSPIQEFIARGVLQGSLQHFFTGKHITLRAIIVSNALFSATHVHLMNGLLAILVFVPGLFWGWLYSRHENLIGVSISHVLIGWTLLFFMDLESLF